MGFFKKYFLNKYYNLEIVYDFWLANIKHQSVDINGSMQKNLSIQLYQHISAFASLSITVHWTQ